MKPNLQKTSPDQPRVVAVHGSASTGAQWRRLADHLSNRYEVSTPDLPGYGTQRGIATCGRPTLYGDAIEIARATFRSPAPVHLIAHSYGAAVALKFAIENPNDVASLILIEPTLFHLLRSGKSDDMVHYTEISSVSNAVRMACFNGAPKRGMAAFIDYWNGEGIWQAMTPYVQAMLAAQGLQVAANFAAAFAETWEPSMCNLIRCPTLVVKSENSRAPVKRVADVVAGAIPNARTTTVADAGHMVPMTHPDLINQLVSQTLAQTTFGFEDALPKAA